MNMAAWPPKMLPWDGDGCFVICEVLQANGRAGKFQAGFAVNHLFNIKRMTVEQPKEHVAYEIKGWLFSIRKQTGKENFSRCPACTFL